MGSAEESAEARKLLKLRLNSIYGSTVYDRCRLIPKELAELKDCYLHGNSRAEEADNDKNRPV